MDRNILFKKLLEDKELVLNYDMPWNQENVFEECSDILEETFEDEIVQENEPDWYSVFTVNPDDPDTDGENVI